MDFIGPYPRTQRGAWYVLVLVDYATRYPEAVALPSLASQGVARTLMRFFSQVRLPKTLLTDQGSSFTSQLMKKVCRLLGIEQLFAAVQHPQTDGLTERLNQTLKGMLAKAVQAHPRSWDLCLGPILFALRESPQTSTGFSPFELVYGRTPRGILKVLEGKGSAPVEDEPPDPATYVGQLHQHLETLHQAARANLLQAQKEQKTRYDQGSRERTLEPGDQVLVSRQAMAHPTGDPWQGPYVVTK